MRVEATAPNGSPYYLFSQHCPNRFLSWLIWGSGCTPQVRLDVPIEKKNLQPLNLPIKLC